MIATTLWLELFLEIVVLSGFAQSWMPDSWRWWTVAVLQPGLFVALRAVLIAGSCMYAWRRDPQRQPLAAPSWLRLWAGETVALLRFNVLMLSVGRSLVPAQSTSRTDVADTLVILLHGVYCNWGIWQPLIEYLRAARANVRIAAPNLTPIRGDLQLQAQRFAQWLDAVATPPPGRVVIVGHSMGGLVARLCIANALMQTRVDELICIGVPHRGSQLARIVPGDVGRDLQPGSNVLEALGTVAAQSKAAVLNIYSRHDNFVIPADSARLDSATNHVLCGVGHMSLVYSAAVWKLVLSKLRIA